MPVAPSIDASSPPVAMLYPELAAELAVTREILSRVPWAQAAYKPHAKSMSLGALASHLAMMPAFVTSMAATDRLEFNPAAFAPPPIANADEMLAFFDAECAKMHAALDGMDWTRLNGSWKMTMGDYTIIDNQRAFLLRHMGINHIVHHRAQLGVYLRMLDVAIPGSYGPSADT